MQSTRRFSKPSVRWFLPVATGSTAYPVQQSDQTAAPSSSRFNRSDRSAEINHLGDLWHSHLVKLIGYCIGDEHKQFMEYMVVEVNLQLQLKTFPSLIQSLFHLEHERRRSPMLVPLAGKHNCLGEGLRHHLSCFAGCALVLYGGRCTYGCGFGAHEFVLWLMRLRFYMFGSVVVSSVYIQRTVGWGYLCTLLLETSDKLDSPSLLQPDNARKD
ncbi:hypothetical protein L195_g006871 [Trifolium pratense]|uniref:Uncharacterized protein n=1 Tax=Trifolium pratense TaxID=57577 RepID=A0A2K3P4T4_TRIPR|nr:hypothetical protein L195_g006871 [Trifolium pratense]